MVDEKLTTRAIAFIGVVTGEDTTQRDGSDPR